MKNATSLLSALLTLFLALAFTACKKDWDENPTTGNTLSNKELTEINENFCGTIDPEDYNEHQEIAGDTGAEDRATGAKGKFWPAGKVIRVRFLNGSSSLQSKVFNYAKTWGNYANVSFSKVTSGTSDVRVKFGTNGSNSYIGTDNSNISQSTPTMNLQLSDASSETSVRAVTLHEFGHALGLKHEHQNPLANISWDKPKVYAYYAQYGWSQQTVNEQVINNLGWGPAQHTGFDASSIMAYYIPASLTTNGFSIPYNTQLSTLDKAFIGKMYGSTKMRFRHAANIAGTITFYINGVYTTLSKNESLYVPVNTTGNTVQIWECPNGCQWSSYTVNYGKNYKIVSASNNANDLKLQQE